MINVQLYNESKPKKQLKSLFRLVIQRICVVQRYYLFNGIIALNLQVCEELNQFRGIIKAPTNPFAKEPLFGFQPT